MKACGFCGTPAPEDAEDYFNCPSCEDEMQVVIIEELETEKIDNHYSGISAFYMLDLLKQRDYIMASDGTDTEKLKKLNEYIDKEFKDDKL